MLFGSQKDSIFENFLDQAWQFLVIPRDVGIVLRTSAANAPFY
jgi:hypothetical protein